VKVARHRALIRRRRLAPQLVKSKHAASESFRSDVLRESALRTRDQVLAWRSAGKTPTAGRGFERLRWGVTGEPSSCPPELVEGSALNVDGAARSADIASDQ